MKQSFLKNVHFFILVVLTGISAGLVAILFHMLINFIHNLLFFMRFSYHSNDMIHTSPSIWGAGVVLVPVVGAAIVVFLVKTFAPEAKGSGVPEVMDAVHYRHSRIRKIVSLIKALASSVTIGSGGSAGREGPIIQIGATVGSVLGQWVKVPDWQRMTLVACGAGGGIAATFNTPIAGILFAIEIILVEFSGRTVIPVCIATAIATYVSYFQFSSSAFFNISSALLPNVHLFDIGMSILLSCLIGLVACIFIRSIYWIEGYLNKLSGSYYIRHCLAMLCVGGILYIMMLSSGHYYVDGVGYATVLSVLTGIINQPGFLLLLLLLKILVTALTLGSGGSGGVFSPLLFIGSCLGACFAILCNQLLMSDFQLSVQFAALAGMAGLVAATTAAPLTAIMMTVELIHDYKMILPFILVVAISCLVRRWLVKESVYTMKLARRGHVISDALLSINLFKKKS